MILRRSERERKKPDRYGEIATYSNYIYVNFVSTDSPTTYEKAVNSEGSLDWKQAMNKGIKCLIKNKTWKLVNRPKDRKILDVKWVYTTKADNRKKARLVVRGFQQEEELDNLYSSSPNADLKNTVSSLLSVRINDTTDGRRDSISKW